MKKWICILLLGLCGCDSLRGPVTTTISAQTVFENGGYCAVPPDRTRSAVSYADSGFAYIEQNCGLFFDKLAEATQAGRFAHGALDAANLGTQSILQAASVAAQRVTLVGSAITLSEAVFDAFVQQYAFTPYLYKIKELTFQALQKHHDDNLPKLNQLKTGFSPDDYCDAFILVQQHARICTISSIQALFDQQVANQTAVVSASTPGKATTPGTGISSTAAHPTAAFPRAIRGPSGYVSTVSPNYTVK
jgi:hypothetical protein